MSKKVLKVLLFAYFFLMIYKPEFRFTFHSVNTTFGLIGFAFFCMNHSKKDFLTYNAATYKPIIRTYLPVIVVSILSVIINMSFDLHFITYIITLGLYYFMAYLGAWGIYKVYGEITPRILLNFYIVAAFIHLGVSLARFANPAVNDILLSILRMSEADQLGLEHTMGGRLQGFGASFFTSGIINGFILIMIAFTLFEEHFSLTKKVFYVISFVFIFVIGLMNARTVMIGGGIGAFILLLSFMRDSKHFITNTIAIGLTVMAIIYVLSLIPSSDIDFDTLSNFGFEMFRALEEGDTSTHSTDTMVSQYSIMPDNLKTWLIGDAMWKGRNSWDYYMGTDIGVFRNLFYFGIIGSICFYLYNWKTLELSIKRNRIFGITSKYVVITLFLYTMILNFKGANDLFYYVLPYYFCGRKMVV